MSSFKKPKIFSYINTLLHFNLEFVAGEYNTYDKLLNEAFEPALDLFIQCPKWHAEIELSGMQLEYMEKEFPWMIDKLRELNKRKQLDVICVHYSETIWPAFPLSDFRASWDIDREIMNRLGLKFSPTFFAQENFFGEGIAWISNEFSIKNAIVPEKNYFWPYTRLNPLYPVYDMDGLNLVVRGDTKILDNKWWVYMQDNAGNPFKLSETARTIKQEMFNDFDLVVKWRYDKCGDGEPWVGGDPYANFWKDESKINQKLELYDEALENGIKFCTTNEFVAEIENLGIKKPKLKPIPDGPWGLKKPGVFQWMGLYFSFYELDVEMRSLSFRSRAMLMSAETLINIASKTLKDLPKSKIEQLKLMIKRGWRYQINSEVSDSSGWVPTLPEMFYAIDRAMLAFYWGEKVIHYLLPLLKKEFAKNHPDLNYPQVSQNVENIMKIPFIIDNEKGDIFPFLTEEPAYIKRINPWTLDMNDGSLKNSAKIKELISQVDKLPENWDIRPEYYGPNQSVRYFRLSPDHYLIKYDFQHMDLKCGTAFNLLEDKLSYSPALMDNEVVSRDFSYYNPNCEYLYLPLPNGLIGLGRDLWVIKQNDSNHVALKFNFKDRKAEFIAEHTMMSLGAREEMGWELNQHWNFHIFHGTEKDALKLAQKINITPQILETYPLWPIQGREPYPWIPFTRMVSK
ncbi:MAG: hypothetical protein ACTSU2_13790 [Promethearchaeota archaeon]